MRPPLADGWTLWPVALLRGAGFPFALLASALKSEDAALGAASWPRLREAIVWQNRSAFVHGVDRLEPGGTLRKNERRALRLFIRYLQRYAAKNDTIGFFGPLGWVRLHANDGGGSFEPADTLVAEQRVCFEPWAVRAILSSCPDTVAKAPLRLAAHLRLEDDLLIGPDRTRAATREEATLIRAAHGCTKERVLIASGASPESCDRLVALGVLQGGPAVAVAADPGARYPNSPVLTRFKGYLRSLEQAAGSANRVSETLAALESDFARTTGRAATRNPGRTYAGRSLVYLDCRRKGVLSLGGDTIGPLRDLLAFLGMVARGYTYAIARELASEMRRILPRGRMFSGAIATLLAPHGSFVRL